MKIAFTSTGSDLSAQTDTRFGRADKFLIYDTDKKRLVVVFNPAADAEQGAGLKAAECITQSGAEVLITGECGPKAIVALQAAKIRVFVTDTPTVSESLVRFEAGQLREQSAS